VPQNFLYPQRDQPLLLPVDMREWLPEDDLVFVVLDAVATLDLGRVPPPVPGRRARPGGQIKTCQKMTTMSRRGFDACHSEWLLAATANNLRKLHTHRLTA
jgi:hypothetical protein